MINLLVFAPALTAVAGLAFGASFYRHWEARTAKKKRRIPVQWQIQARPLFTDVERAVWHWLQSVFHDQSVLVKIPVIRFLSPLGKAQGQHSHELLKSVYCSFTVCAADGTVIGCIDVPGASGLRASRRDMKQKLLAECGIAYAVVSAAALPAKEVVRGVFLGEFEIPEEPDGSYEHPYSRARNAGDPNADTAETVPDTLRALADTPQHMPGEIDMLAVAAARISLQSRLEKNRQTRIANIAALSASLDIVDDNVDRNFAVPWEDSFIMLETAQQDEDARH